MNCPHRFSYVLILLLLFIVNNLSYASQAAVALEAPITAQPFIQAVRIEGNVLHVMVNEEIAQTYLRENPFYVIYDKGIDLSKIPYSILTIPVITNLIAIIWFSGKNYTIPKMDQALCEALIKIKEYFRQIHPQTSWDGELKPEDLVDRSAYQETPHNGEAALLFSGGIDSTSTAFELIDKKIPLTLIMMRGQGSHTLIDDQLWGNQKQLGADFAKRHGMHFTTLTSNYHSFLALRKLNTLSKDVHDWRVDAIEDIGMWGMTAPILYARGIPLLYMSSSVNWAHPYPSVGNPLVDSLLSFGNTIGIESAQFDKSRTDKIAYIASQVLQKLKPQPLITVACFPAAAFLTVESAYLLHLLSMHVVQILKIMDFKQPVRSLYSR
jgi:hypothetical protein